MAGQPMHNFRYFEVFIVGKGMNNDRYFGIFERIPVGNRSKTYMR